MTELVSAADREETRRVLTAGPCQCVWDVHGPRVHVGHCCGIHCAVHEEIITNAAVEAGGRAGWLHTAASRRRELLGITGG